MVKDLAVIIPIAPGDNAWMHLITDFSIFPKEVEIIFVGPRAPTEKLPPRIKWVTSKLGRGHQLNIGAGATNKKYLWFLHSDSQLPIDALDNLEYAFHVNPSAIYYFNLAFSQDGPSLMFINSLGVWFRSHFLKLPYGDQGFCVRRGVFSRLGGFRENLPYGEDHDFIWQAHLANIPVRCTGSWIRTSARKYQQNGWSRQTLKHLQLGAKQAVPNFFKLLRTRVMA
ncbi:MAG: hypothetical protein SGJ18_14810 [Pseudomonadota bacterium]|nr:hypothetical protein [Pseudomonadota bacterium]